MKINDVKRFNLGLLAHQLGGRASLAEKLGYTDTNHINQMVGGFSPMGPKLTQKIYDAIELPTLWLETPHWEPWIALGDKTFQKWYDENRALVDKTIEFEKSTRNKIFENVGSFEQSVKIPGDSGTDLDVDLLIQQQKDYVSIQSYERWSNQMEKEARSMTLPVEWLREKEISVRDLVSIEVEDDAQSPAMKKGDYAAIHLLGDRQIKNNKIYALKLQGELVLRLFSIHRNGDVRLCCANESFAYAEELVPAEELPELEVLGEYVGGVVRSL